MMALPISTHCCVSLHYRAPEGVAGTSARSNAARSCGDARCSRHGVRHWPLRTAAATTVATPRRVDLSAGMLERAAAAYRLRRTALRRTHRLAGGRFADLICCSPPIPCCTSATSPILGLASAVMREAAGSHSRSAAAIRRRTALSLPPAADSVIATSTCAVRFPAPGSPTSGWLRRDCDLKPVSR